MKKIWYESSFGLRPVPNSTCVSALDQYKCNPLSLLNPRLFHVTFLTCQTCVLFDFTMVRPGPIP